MIWTLIWRWFFFLKSSCQVTVAFSSGSFILGIIKVSSTSNCRRSSCLSMFSWVELWIMIKKATCWNLSLNIWLTSTSNKVRFRELVISSRSNYVMLLLLNLLFINDFAFVIIWHGFNHVLSCLSNDVLIADVDFILIAATTCCGSNVPIFKTLNSITENAIVLSVFNVLPLNFLKVSGSHGQLMSLVTQLFLIADA